MLLDTGAVVEVEDVLRFLGSASGWEGLVKRWGVEWRVVSEVWVGLRSYAAMPGVPVRVVVRGGFGLSVGTCVFEVEVGASAYLDGFAGSFEGLIETLRGGCGVEAGRVSVFVERAERESG